MKAIICTRYGAPDVLELREVETPSPKDDEVLIRVHAATVMAGDCQLRGMTLSIGWQIMMRLAFGLRAPTKGILGQELAGEVESAGRDVTRFGRGDKVFGFTGLRLGAYAEYSCLPERFLVEKPVNMTYDEAAALPNGGLCALPLLRRGNIHSGQSILIVGAAGTIGTFAVQMAKSFGAEVTGVDSGRKLDVLRSIGADHLVDYTQEDFTKNGEKYDVIFDTVGKTSFADSMRSLSEDGLFLMGNPSLFDRVRGRWSSMRGGKKVIAETASYKNEDLVFLRKLVEQGKMKTVIDRRFPLEETAEAHRYVDTGEKTGNVIITIP